MSVDSFFSRLNPLVRGILGTPVLHWLLSPGLMLLTVTGRRSGRRYTIPVGYRKDGDDLTVLVSEAREKQWWRNYLERRPVEVRLRGRDRQGTACVLTPDAPDYRARVEAVLRRVPGMDGVFGIDFDRKAGLSEAQVATLAREIAVVQVVLSP